MASAPLYTGNASTFVLGTTGAIGTVVSGTLPTHTLEAVENSSLGSTDFAEYQPGDLFEPGTVDMVVVVDLENLPTFTTAGAVAETLTITLGVGGTLSGTGFLTSFGGAEVANNTRGEAAVTFQFDGGTGPTYTAAV